MRPNDFRTPKIDEDSFFRWNLTQDILNSQKMWDAQAVCHVATLRVAQCSSTSARKVRQAHPHASRVLFPHTYLQQFRRCYGEFDTISRCYDCHNDNNKLTCWLWFRPLGLDLEQRSISLGQINCVQQLMREGYVSGAETVRLTQINVFGAVLPDIHIVNLTRARAKTTISLYASFKAQSISTC